MAQPTATWFLCDHTFKVVPNEGLLRASDRKWEKQYDSMFAVLNEDGIVLAWQLTKGTAFENVKHRFDLQKNNAKLWVINNCCTWRMKNPRRFWLRNGSKVGLVSCSAKSC